MTPGEERRAVDLVEQLKGWGVNGGMIVKMARDGQLLRIRCEMPYCYYEGGRRAFTHRMTGEAKWQLSFDHYPRLADDEGPTEPGNARLAHRYCNSVDQGRRAQIRELLNLGLSLREIAEKLNRRNKAIPPYPYTEWTAALVRKAQIS
jgi:hypothetical protein